MQSAPLLDPLIESLYAPGLTRLSPLPIFSIPARYCDLLQQLLDHLSESGIYTESDLQPFAQRLAELRAIISRDSDGGKHPPQLTKLMMRKLEGCGKCHQDREPMTRKSFWGEIRWTASEVQLVECELVRRLGSFVAQRRETRLFLSRLSAEGDCD